MDITFLSGKNQEKIVYKELPNNSKKFIIKNYNISKIWIYCTSLIVFMIQFLNFKLIFIILYLNQRLEILICY